MMIKYLFTLFVLISTTVVCFAQKADTVKTIPAKNTKPEIEKVVTQDTVKKEESRKERRKREKAEKEAKEKAEEVFKDSARLAIEHKSKVAWKRSLILPGWGQHYNGGVWWIKVPVIYGGFVSTGLIIEFNQRYYSQVLKELDFRISTGDTERKDPELRGMSTTGLIQAKDNFRRNRDLAILGTLGWYGLNIVEAYVDSMLKNRWNIGDAKNVNIRFSPTIISNNSYAFQSGPIRPTVGLKMTMQFK
ncbi:DUF5683 domain-containing protein [Sphingobacterium spiritivorum]|uniref:DUF5683 domain-containing protein n=1 Tax=Sphingobacterium spiritivorum TaxID=258 RepID=UPI003DA4476A